MLVWQSGEIRLQLADEEWWDNVSLTEVIALVKKAGKKKKPKSNYLSTLNIIYTKDLVYKGTGL